MCNSHKDLPDSWNRDDIGIFTVCVDSHILNENYNKNDSVSNYVIMIVFFHAHVLQLVS